MTGRIIKYSEPVPFHKAMPGAKSIVIMKRDEPVVASTAKPKNIPNVKKETTVTDYSDDISQGPYYSMLDRQARARQQQTGESYEKAFTKVYEDPANKAIVDNARLNHLEQSYDSRFGTRLSAIPVAKSAPYDPIAKKAEIAEQFGPAHAKLHSMAVDNMRAHAGQSYESAYSLLYSRMENAPLREKIKAEHLRASMAAVQSGDGLGKAAPADPKQDYATGSATNELKFLVAKRMKADPNLSYERAFTAEYLLPENRMLKAQYDSEAAPGFSPYRR